MDNHNHALYGRIKHAPTHQNIEIAHIDAHADMGENSNKINQQVRKDEAALREFINMKCTIANFIPPFLEAYPAHCAQIRTEYALLEYTIPSSSFFILDIDIDFWALDEQVPAQQRKKLKSLIQYADLITIATSPLFIDQTKALQLVNQIMKDNN